MSKQEANTLDGLLEPIETKPAKPSAPAGASRSAKPATLRHQHPKSDHPTVYSPLCPLCRHEDEQRRWDPSTNTPATTPIPEDQLARTLFLVPCFDPEMRCCIEYLNRRYSGAAKQYAHTIQWPRLLALPEFQVVVVRRVARPDQTLRSHFKMVPTERPNQFTPKEMPAREFVDEVLESAPVQMRDFAVERSFSLNATEVDPRQAVVPLVTTLQDIAGPEYRIMLHNDPDTTLVFMNA